MWVSALDELGRNVVGRSQSAWSTSAAAAVLCESPNQPVHGSTEDVLLHGGVDLLELRALFGRLRRPGRDPVNERA